MPLLGVGNGAGTIPAITAANILSGGSVVSATSYVTGSISPTANKLDIISVANTCVAACGTLTPTVTGAGGTWVQIGTQRSATNFISETMFRDLSASPGSGALTIDFAGVSQSKVIWSVDEFGGINTSGTHGSGAIVQFVSATDVVSETSMSCTLAALGATTNAGYGHFRIGLVTTITDNLTHLSSQSVTALNGDAQWGINNTALTWSFATSAATKLCAAVEVKNGV